MLRRSCFCGLLAALVCVGCTKNNPKFEKTFPVRGQVVLASGSPVTGGRITFHPKENRGDAWAMIGKDGRFELGTYGKDDGAMLGTYTVTVEALVYDPSGNLRPNPSAGIPSKYASTETSDLTVEIKEGGEQELKITLK